MILESIIIFFSSITVITVSTLVFVDRQIKREIELANPSAIKKSPTKIKDGSDLLPFEFIHIGILCKLCQTPAKNVTFDKNGFLKDPSEGPGVPKITCPTSCKYYKTDIKHLHVYCNNCKGTWLMKTAQDFLSEKEQSKPINKNLFPNKKSNDS